MKRVRFMRSHYQRPIGEYSDITWYNITQQMELLVEEVMYNPASQGLCTFQ